MWIREGMCGWGDHLNNEVAAGRVRRGGHERPRGCRIWAKAGVGGRMRSLGDDSEGRDLEMGKPGATALRTSKPDL